MTKTSTWIKMFAGGAAMCIGGPALIYYVSPTEEELFLRYNPELQKRSLANRQERQEDFDQFVTRLKQYSKSDKPIWTVWEAEAKRLQDEAAQKATSTETERRATSDAMKAEQLSTSEALRAELKKGTSR